MPRIHDSKWQQIIPARQEKVQRDVKEERIAPDLNISSWVWITLERNNRVTASTIIFWCTDVHKERVSIFSTSPKLHQQQGNDCISDILTKAEMNTHLIGSAFSTIRGKSELLTTAANCTGIQYTTILKFRNNNENNWNPNYEWSWMQNK